MAFRINKVTALFLVIILQNMLVSGLQTTREDIVIPKSEFNSYLMYYINSDFSLLISQHQNKAIYRITDGIPTLFQQIEYQDQVSQMLAIRLTLNQLAIYAINTRKIFYAERASVNDQFPPLKTLYTTQGTIYNIQMSPDATSISWKEYITETLKLFYSPLDKSNPADITITAQEIATNLSNSFYFPIFLTETLLAYADNQNKVNIFQPKRGFLNPFELPSPASDILIEQSEGALKIMGIYAGTDTDVNVFVYDYNNKKELVSSTVSLEEGTAYGGGFYRFGHCFVFSYDKATYKIYMFIGKIIEEAGAFSIDWSPSLLTSQDNDDEFVIPVYTVLSQNVAFLAKPPFIAMLPAREDTPTQPIDCSLDIASTSSSISDSQCQCLLHHSWDSLQGKCVANCKTRFAVQPKADNPLECQCQAKAAWEPKEKLCLLDCPSIPYSTGQRIGNEICQCKESSVWNPRTLSCDPKCQGQFSTGVLTDGACECTDGALWNPRKGICQRDCSLIDHASFQKPNPDGSCTCDSGFAWVGEVCQVVDCSSIPYVDTTQEQTQEAQGICICQSSFDWDGSQAQCVLDCSKVSGTLHTDQNTAIHACGCKPGSFWQQLALQCFINCTQIDHALSEIVSAEECVCESDFMWKEGQCVTTCGLNIGEATTFNQNDNHCDCLSGFQYYFNSPEGGACYRSCSAIANTEGYFGTTPGSCTCIVGLNWNDQTSVCENLCQGPYDTQTNVVTPANCDCVQPAVFSSAIGKCMPICRNDPLSVGSFNFDSFGCYCKTNAHWNKASVSCECNSGYQENSDLKKCETLAAGSSVPIAVGGAVCSGGAVFLGMFLRQKKKEKEETGESKNVFEDKVQDV